MTAPASEPRVHQCPYCQRWYSDLKLDEISGRWYRECEQCHMRLWYDNGRLIEGEGHKEVQP